MFAFVSLCHNRLVISVVHVVPRMADHGIDVHSPEKCGKRKRTASEFTNFSVREIRSIPGCNKTKPAKLKLGIFMIVYSRESRV